ncbi:rho guanine nucleotide exchange factor 19 isoform X1 [Xenopus laevis]|uniref:Rho guanine nucleotide exchange factor 19 isoform X1 n=1 Tax=Xenopus laevis TaxID=8355 RepID=A0A8J0TDH7_XENLA|nr:rho guanine nucleotide exchange factor 19 isoform X1 [Xenopus laevis]
MDLSCRKRSCTTSPPPIEVTVKRCFSCPETTKPLVPLRPIKPLAGFFYPRKSFKRLGGNKWRSYEDVQLRVQTSQPKIFEQIEEGDHAGSVFFSNPLYEPPEPESRAATPTPAPSCSAPAIDGTTRASPSAPSLCCNQAEQDPSESGIFGRFRHKDPSKRQRRESKFVHTQPLYQDYWLHHAKEDTYGHGSFSLDSSLSFAGLLSSSLAGGSPVQMSSQVHSSSLWQDLPKVKKQKIMDKMTPHQRQLQETIFEVLTSEASYQRSLSLAINHFQNSRKLSECLGATDQHTLFSNLPAVWEVSQRYQSVRPIVITSPFPAPIRFLQNLEEALERDIFLRDTGKLILLHCPEFHRVYIPYVTNQMYQENLMQRLVKENGRFLQVLQKLEEKSECKRQSLKSFLILPFQRITRLKILLENILKLAQDDLELADSARRSLAAVGQIVTACNEGVKRMKEIEDLVLLEKQVEFSNTKFFPLISRGRVLLKHGELVQIFFQEMGPGHRHRLSTKPIYVHLFSDLLMMSRTEYGRYLVEDYTSRGQVKADNFRAKQLGLPDFTFLLRLRPSHAGVNCEYILKSSSETEKQQWISLINGQMCPALSC